MLLFSSVLLSSLPAAASGSAGWQSDFLQDVFQAVSNHPFFLLPNSAFLLSPSTLPQMTRTTGKTEPPCFADMISLSYSPSLELAFSLELLEIELSLLSTGFRRPELLLALSLVYITSTFSAVKGDSCDSSISYLRVLKVSLT